MKSEKEILRNINTWKPIWSLLHKTKILTRWELKKIPQEIRKRYFVKYIVHGYAKYHKKMAKIHDGILYKEVR